MKWGDPAASSVIRIDPVRDPSAVGVKVTENVQLPAAGMLVPQLSVSPKSGPTEIAEIDSGELPMLRSSPCCGGLVAPICCGEYCRLVGLKDTEGAEKAPSFITNASVLPPSRFWKALPVTG